MPQTPPVFRGIETTLQVGELARFEWSAHADASALLCERVSRLEHLRRTRAETGSLTIAAANGGGTSTRLPLSAAPSRTSSQESALDRLLNDADHRHDGMSRVAH